MHAEVTAIRLLLASILIPASTLAAPIGFAQTPSDSHKVEYQNAISGEGLYRPSESGAPLPIIKALSGVVRVASKIRFRLSLFGTSEEAAAARKKAGARDKQFLPEGGVIWPVIMARSDLHQLCADSAQSAQPGFHELCGAETAVKGPLPQTVMTSPVEGSGSGFVVGRLDNGDYIVATAYHVAREAIERNHRTRGVRAFRPESVSDLIVGVSRDRKHTDSEYIPVSDVRLLANASEKGWERGEDWALLAIGSKGLPPLAVIPIAKLVPMSGERVWVVGFPTRTRRQLPSDSPYHNASDDLRISSGIIVADADARKVSAASDLLSTVDGVAGNSGSVVLNDSGEVVGLFRHHTGKDGELDLRIARYQGLAQIVPVQFFASLLPALRAN
jgi:S1-C subfamily serine protease